MNTIQTTSPKTLQDACVMFADPQRALDYMMPLVWPHGVTCPHCGVVKEHHYIASRRIWRCLDCGKQFSIKIGTIMEDSPLGLDKWLCAMWLIANAKNGISSWEIHRALGVTQKSAWFLLHRIRLAMKTGTFKKMGGTTEVDEVYIGGDPKNFSKSKKKALHAVAKKARPGKPVNLRRYVKKAIVMGLLERGTNGGPSQVRTTMSQSARRPHISEIVKAHVNPGSFLMTDAHPSYRGMGAEGFIHMTINHALKYAESHIHTNGIENFWSLLKRSINGTYVAIEPFHLEAYLDEQAFRFNKRTLNDAERMARVVAGIGGKRVTYAELTGKAEQPTVN